MPLNPLFSQLYAVENRVVVRRRLERYVNDNGSFKKKAGSEISVDKVKVTLQTEVFTERTDKVL
jgi:hypothetical protein